jgi:hypothetical protein
VTLKRGIFRTNHLIDAGRQIRWTSKAELVSGTAVSSTLDRSTPRAGWVTEKDPHLSTFALFFSHLPDTDN